MLWTLCDVGNIAQEDKLRSVMDDSIRSVREDSRPPTEPLMYPKCRLLSELAADLKKWADPPAINFDPVLRWVNLDADHRVENKISKYDSQLTDVIATIAVC